MKRAICANQRDNVATLIDHAKEGEGIMVELDSTSYEITLQKTIPIFHKIALRDISEGETVLKYGEAIGKASKAIKKGDHVHVHNVDSSRGRGEMKGAEK
jgi:altronate dehydratase small subunit